MRHLNYNHLLYFYTVAREGSVVRAAKVLHLTPQTVSGQIKLLEDVVGEPLFIRVGRGLTLSDTGRVVQTYADEIFSLGTALTQRLSSTAQKSPRSLRVGVVDSFPKLVACRLLGGTLTDEDPARLSCTEGKLEALLADLSVHKLDLILSDRPVPTELNVRAYNHVLGSSKIGFFAPDAWAERLSSNFPHSLADVPILLPNASSALRRTLDHWFDENEIVPKVAAEFDDSALMKTFGEAGLGVFPAPEVIAEDDISRSFSATQIGSVAAVTETYIAISPQRNLRHPSVLRIANSAKAVFSV
ncbi:transcriptional activator NhaR [Granulosicoccus sp.]|nr:transcriptional activator NhaR [Granulosicoccus sp.]MDB4222460.1 transcriptional activator NhaR [Granulosicoccus sp.]